MAHLIHDPISGTDHVWLHGAEEEPLALALVTTLAFFIPMALFEDLENARDAKTTIDTLFRIAVSFPFPHGEAEHAFRYFSTHPHPVVRRATLQAIAYRTIPAYFDVLRAARDGAPNEENRAFAAEPLGTLERCPP